MSRHALTKEGRATHHANPLHPIRRLWHHCTRYDRIKSLTPRYNVDAKIEHITTNAPMCGDTEPAIPIKISHADRKDTIRRTAAVDRRMDLDMGLPSENYAS